MECVLIFALESLGTTQSNDSSWCKNFVPIFSRLVLFRLSLMDVFYAHPWISMPLFKVCGATGTSTCVQFSSVAQSCPTLCDPVNCSMPGLPVPSPTLGVHPNPCPSNRWCHPAISSSVVPFSCPQSFPASGSFQMSQLFTWGGQSIGVSASTSVFPMNTQDSSPLGWTGWISLQSKGLLGVFSNTTVQKHQFFGTQLSSKSNSHIHTWPLEKP